ESLRNRLYALCNEYKDIFSSSLRPEPANIEPLYLQVDLDSWRTKSNRLPARPTTQVRQAEIRKQVDIMLEANVIEPSEATEWSQVVLTPKPDFTWRFCLD